jgi:flagellar biogenesis protein FliO
MKRQVATVLAGVAMAVVWPRGSAAEPATANQSASVEPAVEASSAPHAETPVLRSRLANRRPGVQNSGLLSADGTTPWYRTGLGALTVVLALVCVLYLAARKWVPTAKPVSSAAMAVVARAAVTPKHSLATVQWGRRFLLLGLGPERVETLAEIDEPGEATELAGTLGVRWPAGAAAFDDALMAESAAFEEASAPLVSERVARTSAVNDLLRRLKSLRST